MPLYQLFKKYIANHTRESAFRPTSDDFDANKLHSILNKLPVEEVAKASAEDLLRIGDFVDVSALLHDIYKGFYSRLKLILENLNMRGEDIVGYFIGIFNYEYIAIYKKLEDASLKLPKGPFLFQEMSNRKIQLADGTKDDVMAVFEGLTDSLSLLCNYLRYNLNKEFINKDSDPKAFAGNLLEVFQMAIEYESFKYSYDDMLYDDSFVRVEGGRVSFDYEDEKNVKLKALGRLILSERIMDVDWQLRARKENKAIDQFVTNYRIKKVTIENGSFSLEFGQGEPKGHKEIALSIQAAIKAYFEFLDLNLTLEKFGGVSIAEVLGVWAALQYICYEILDKFRLQKGVLYTKEELDVMPRMVKAVDLLTYVVKLTGIKQYRVLLVLNAFEVDWSSFNDIWARPLYKIKGYYYVPLYPILCSVPFGVIESVMQRGGYDLEKRGYDFEHYVYKQIVDASHRFPLDCWAAKKYGRRNNNQEEIDLLLSLKDVIVLAEAKCIHYSMGPKNSGDAWKRLVEGAEQAKRKAEYIKGHPELFEELGEVARKKIIPVVLTNYPLFTGINAEGVYVIDSHSFVSYFNSGVLTLRELSKVGNPIIKTISFYNNETEFSAAFERYLQENPIKKIHMGNMEMTEIPLFPKSAPGLFKAKAAQYRGDPRFDILNTSYSVEN